MESDYSTNGGYYYYFIFRFMPNKLITMVISGKKMGIWGKEWKGDLHFAVFTFFCNIQTLYPLHILPIQNNYWFEKYYMYICSF